MSDRMVAVRMVITSNLVLWKCLDTTGLNDYQPILVMFIIIISVKLCSYSHSFLMYSMYHRHFICSTYFFVYHDVYCE